MGDIIKNLSDFSQGILASVLGGLILAILFFVLRIFSKQIRESARVRKAKLKDLKQQVRANVASERTEAGMMFMFRVLMYLFLGNIAWVLPEAINAVLGFYPAYLLKFVSLLFFVLGLRWVSRYYSAKSAVTPKLEIVAANWGSADKQIDITAKLAHHIINNALTIRASNSICGQDPDQGVSKVLTVKYRFDGVEHEGKFHEKDLVRLP